MYILYGCPSLCLCATGAPTNQSPFFQDPSAGELLHHLFPPLAFLVDECYDLVGNSIDSASIGPLFGPVLGTFFVRYSVEDIKWPKNWPGTSEVYAYISFSNAISGNFWGHFSGQKIPLNCHPVRRGPREGRSLAAPHRRRRRHARQATRQQGEGHLGRARRLLDQTQARFTSDFDFRNTLQLVAH